ncbi:MAG: phenylalanine--tRNA ligase subunit alpha [Actinobacteria bacterium]|nr:phenylalanine--tRNA ligase subunit alpha [Actinomycetota bacterium]
MDSKDGLAYDQAVREALGEKAEQEVSSCETLEALRQLEGALLGKRSRLAQLHQQLGSLDPSERKVLGRLLNERKARLKSLIDTRRAELDRADEQARLAAERMDLTEVIAGRRRGTLHLVSRTQSELEDTFVGMGFTVAEGPEVETDWNNFEALNIPPDHPARGMWDTFYLDVGKPESVLMRTHTSPVQVRLMQSHQPPIYSVMPGRCYRRDTPDARHLSIFHQIEGLVVDTGISFSDLAGTIEAFTTTYFGPSIHSRLRPAYFPFTEPSAEFEITCTICEGQGCRTCSQTGWIELGGCGMVDPEVFASVGIDSEIWTGFAFGFGIDRCAQMRQGIADLRILMENDIRFLEQA